MKNYPGPAQTLVQRMIKVAAANPLCAVAFQGAPGANSHIAVCQVFPDWLPLPCFSFEDALEAVREGQASCAVIPIENSLHGRVADVHFLLPESGLFIVGEHFLPIRHCLIGSGALASVTEVMSHPQALGQARKWLRVRGIQPIPFPDTAGAIAALAEMGAPPHIAALAPELAAELYRLPIICSDVADDLSNTTRFLTLAREPMRNLTDSPNTTTFLFSIVNSPGALCAALGAFASNGINLIKLESYQCSRVSEASSFYIDVEGSPSDPKLARAIEELALNCQSLRILGTYSQLNGR